jgi:hypothetical protein
LKTIEKYLTKKQGEFAQHSFFAQIAESRLLNEFGFFAQQMTFWVMTFQDVLRLNEARFASTDFQKIAHSHRLEDEGHNLWFLSDLNQMQIDEPNLRILYSQDHVLTRDATYALVSEIFRAPNDYQRIAFLLTLESLAHVFFERTSNSIKNIGYSSKLKYFSDYHFEIEESHESLGQSLEICFDGVHLNQDDETSIFDMIDRVHTAFKLMFDGLETTLNRAKSLSLV